MADSRLNFILSGRDNLSRVLDRAGDSARQLGRRLLVAQIEGSAAINRLADTSSNRLAGMQRDSDAGGKAVEALKKTFLSLAPAAIPAAAGIAGALAPVVAGTGAAALAAAAYGAALGPQIAALKEAAEAETKYTDAVEKSGAGSKEAATAQNDYARAMAKLPPETRLAAAQLSVLKDEYDGWSDSLARDTMGPVVKGLSLFTGLLPKATGLVRGTSGELDRMVTIAGGAMATPGFDSMVGRFEGFAVGTLRKVNDGIVSLVRNGDSGKVGSNVREFMDFAQAQGPTVRKVLVDIGGAVLNVLRAGADTGVGLLQLVSVFASVIAAVPPGAISLFLQLAVALKVVKLAALGLAAGRTALAAFGVTLVAMQAAAAGAPGRLAAVGAAIGSLSRAAKIALIGTGIGLLVVAISELSQMGRSAPPDVDKLTSSLQRFAETGKVSGEAARVFGSDLSKLGQSLRELSRPSNLAGFQQWATQLIGMDSTPVKEAKENLDGADKALAALVQGGKADLARAAFDRLAAGMQKQGLTADELRSQMDDYDTALANVRTEQQMAAQSLGLFGAQSQQVQQKLNAQKQSADGLRQSIQALNDTNRSALGGQIGFEAALDATTAAIKGNSTALSMSGNSLNLTTEKSRTAASALNDLAAKTDEAAAQARANGASWNTVNAIYARGREALIRSADAMGLTRDQARRLADQILKTPDKTARLRGNLQDLEAKLASAKRQLGSVPDSRKAAIKAQITDLQNKVAAAKRALAQVQSKTVTITAHYRKDGASFLGASGRYAEGGLVRFASGGPVGYPGGGAVRGPGTGTSDSIMAMVSNGEFVVRAAAVARYGLGLFEALNSERLGTRRAARPVSAGRSATVSAPRASTPQQVTITVNIHGATDPIATARETRRELLKLKRGHGLNVELGVG